MIAIAMIMLVSDPPPHPRPLYLFRDIWTRRDDDSLETTNA